MIFYQNFRDQNSYRWDLLIGHILALLDWRLLPKVVLFGLTFLKFWNASFRRWVFFWRFLSAVLWTIFNFLNSLLTLALFHSKKLIFHFSVSQAFSQLFYPDTHDSDLTASLELSSNHLILYFRFHAEAFQ